MKVLIINLEKDRNRYLNIVKQLEDNNCYNYQRIDAVYGKDHYKEYKSRFPNLPLFEAELGCSLSHLKAISEIVKQNLEYAVILEDDVTLTDWFPKLESIITNDLPKSFDICWIGNCETKLVRNACNMIPNYDYDKLEKYRINKYIYKIEDISDQNRPTGTYGVVISNKAARKVLNDKNNLSEAIDHYLVKNVNLERYMTIPSIIVHCYDFDSNIRPGAELKVNPFDNVWKKNARYETYVLEILEKITELFGKYGINYSLAFGTLIGYGRNKKFISYDDDIDIIINRNELDNLKQIIPEIKSICNIYTYDTPILDNTLYYKLYPYDYIEIKNNDFGWPFIDILVYDKNDDYIEIEKKIFKIGEDFKYDYITSNNPKNSKKYKIQVFKDYKTILDGSYKDWDKICVSSEYDHRKQKNNPFVYSFNCANIIPDYETNENKSFYSKKDNNPNDNPNPNDKKKSDTNWLLIFFSLISLAIFIYMLFKK